MITLSILTTLLALSVTIICVFFAWRDGREVKETGFQLQRRSLLSFFICIIFYLLFSLYRNFDGNIEVAQVMSLISLYLIFEVFFFSATAFNQHYFFNKKEYLAFFNSPVLIVLLVHIVLLLTHHTKRYASMTEYVRDFSSADTVHAYLRLCFLSILLIYMLIMVYLTFASWREQELEIRQNYPRRHPAARIGKIILLWFAMLVAFYIGQFTNIIIYQIIVKIMLIALIVYTMLGFQRFYIIVYKSNSNTRYVELRKKINRWLNSEPYPLSSQETSIELISKQLEIDRDDFSYFIYSICGLTFNGWLSSRRLEKCVELLGNPELNLSEIAYITGYSHLAAMSKAFKAKYGLSPREYRKKHFKEA